MGGFYCTVSAGAGVESIRLNLYQLVAEEVTGTSNATPVNVDRMRATISAENSRTFRSVLVSHTSVIT